MRRLGVLILILSIGFLLWWNYGWILWNLSKWRRNAEVFAIRHFGDSLERQARRLGGPVAIDCGRVAVYGNPKTANECCLKALRENHAFRVRYDLRGMDSDVSVGMVYTPGGKLYILTFDGDPQGQGGTSLTRQRVGAVECSSPFDVYVGRDGHLTCAVERNVKQNIKSPVSRLR
jgi:hypothetical protein